MSEIPGLAGGMEPARPAMPTTADRAPTAAATTHDRTQSGPVVPADAGTAGLPAPVFAKYQPVRGLGTGGEAHLVMLVRQRTSGEHRVVKVYGTVARPDPVLLDRLQDTGPAQQLAHLVRLYEWGEHTDQWGVARCWEVLEYVEGGSLADLIRAEGPQVPEDLVREVLRETAAALTYLHSGLAGSGQAGLAHRDVKPENLLVRRRHPLDLVLCDFGLVTAIRATRLATGRAGTPLYQAPETWWRLSGEPAQDWWALGVVVAEMLIGRNPNSGPDGAAPDERVLFEHLATHDVDLSEITDERWRLVCRGLLTRSPEHRWGADQLAAWLDGGSPPVHAGDPVVMGQPRRASHPFEVGGTLCESVAELAEAMHRHPGAAAASFLDRGRREDLRAWLDDNFDGGGVPIDVIRADATSEHEAHHRVARLVSLAAPHLPARYAGQPADATGLAVQAKLAVTGDAAAAGFVAQIDGPLMSALARHDPRLTAAARELDPALAAVRRRLAELESGSYQASGAQAALQHAGRTAPAAVLGAVADPQTLQSMRKHLRGQRRARRCPWWAALATDATGASRRSEQVAATALATVLAPAAVAEHAVGRQAARRKSPRRTRPGWQALRTDAAHLLIAVLLGYLATFIALSGYLMFVLEFSPANAATATGLISQVQAPLLPPLSVLLGCLLIRPADPTQAASRAVVLTIGLACAAVVGLWSGYGEWVDYPVTVSPRIYDGLAAVNGRFGSWFVIVALVVYTPALIYLIARLRSRSYRTPRPGRRPAATALRLAVALAVITTYVFGKLQMGPFEAVSSFPVVLWR